MASVGMKQQQEGRQAAFRQTLALLHKTQPTKPTVLTQQERRHRRLRQHNTGLSGKTVELVSTLARQIPSAFQLDYVIVCTI